MHRRRRRVVWSLCRHSHHPGESVGVDPRVPALRFHGLPVLSLSPPTVYFCILRVVHGGVVSLPGAAPRAAVDTPVRDACLGQHPWRLRGGPRCCGTSRPRPHRGERGGRALASAPPRRRHGGIVDHAPGMHGHNLRESARHQALGLRPHGAVTPHQPALHRRMGASEPVQRPLVHGDADADDGNAGDDRLSCPSPEAQYRSARVVLGGELPAAHCDVVPVGPARAPRGDLVGHRDRVAGSRIARA